MIHTSNASLQLLYHSVRLVILVTQEKAIGKIFDQFVYADGVGKLVAAIDQQLKMLV